MSHQPKPRRQLAVTGHSEQKRLIWFEALPDIADEIRDASVGQVTYNELTGQHELRVNGLYDYQEVLDWLRAIESTGALRQ